MRQLINSDFTIQKYEALCQLIAASSYRTITFNEYVASEPLPEKFIMLRHDVDRKLMNALALAKLENEYGLRATYYFRSTSRVFRPSIIKEIGRMGHEIGYHYEVLSKALGDGEKAIRMFEMELDKFREVGDIKTICMHGSPLSKYDNRDLWKAYDYKKYGLKGEAYLSSGEDLYYFSDTGRNWGRKNKLRDLMPAREYSMMARTTDDIMALIRSAKLDRLYLLIHPERWALNDISWITGSVIDMATNAGKMVIEVYRGL